MNRGRAQDHRADASGQAPPGETEDRLAETLERAASGETDARTLVRAGGLALSSLRSAGARAVASGRWLADVVIRVAARLPARDLDALSRHHDGLLGDRLAEALVRAASRSSAAVGAAAGALITAGELSPAGWASLPVELVVETLAVVAIELKLVAELHEVYGRPVTGTPAAKGVALARAWAEARGIRPGDVVRGGSLSETLGRGVRSEIVRIVRRRVVRRLGRNVGSLAPLFVGAVAGAELNRRATAALGEAVARDLARHGPRRRP